MKANEIQIGYWLYYKDQFNAFPFKVESITKKKVGYHAEPNEHRIHYLRLSECKPIPFTSEILEKNGFEESKFFKVMYWSNIDKERIKVSWSPDGDFYLECCGEKGRYEGGCNFIHELQHALCLCGIEKEIIL